MILSDQLVNTTAAEMFYFSTETSTQTNNKRYIV